MRELTKTTPPDVCASSNGVRHSREPQQFVAVSVTAWKTMEFLHSVGTDTQWKFLWPSWLTVEHNEMSPLMLLLIMRALFRKKKKKERKKMKKKKEKVHIKQKKNRNLCSCWMQNKKHFDNLSFFPPVNKPQTCWETIKKINKRKNAHNEICLYWLKEIQP